MALKIRLTRQGAKKRPFYRVVVAEASSPRDGRYIERLGIYNPMLPKDHADRVTLNGERIQHWIGNGAKATDRVARLLATAGLSEAPQRSNPEKAKPKAKAQERLRAQEESRKAAEAAAAEAATAEAEAPAETVPAEEPVAEAEEAPVEEAAAEEAPAEDADQKTEV